MKNQADFLLNGKSYHQVIYDMVTHTHALMAANLRIQCQILAHLYDSDVQEIYKTALKDYDNLLKEISAEIGAKHGDITIDMAKVLSLNKPSGKH